MHKKEDVIKVPEKNEEKPSVYDYLELSRYSWGLLVEKAKANDFPGHELITMACAQRSAHAMESIAANTVGLVNDYISVKEQLALARIRIKALEAENAALSKMISPNKMLEYLKNKSFE